MTNSNGWGKHEYGEEKGIFKGRKTETLGDPAGLHRKLTTQSTHTKKKEKTQNKVTHLNQLKGGVKLDFTGHLFGEKERSQKK